MKSNKKIIILIIALLIADGALFLLNTAKKETAPAIILPPKTEESPVVKNPAPEMEILNPSFSTGETLIVQFNEAPGKVAFDGKEFTPFPYQEDFRAIIPVALGSKTGIYDLTAEFANGATIEKTVSLFSKEQLVIVLPPPPKLGLTDKQIVQNLSTSNTDLKKIVAAVEEITRFSEPFGLPVRETSIISSPFGEIRKTGEQSIVHLGTDFDVPKGTPVYAINAGVVKNAYLDSIYGNSVIIDHGRGIYSLYLHLDSMSVKNGDAVQKGEVVGAAGDSGLASAPHLHLSLKVGGVSVDPIQFINTFK